MFVLQFINIMNQLWLKNNHDLNLITFNVLQTGNKRGIFIFYNHVTVNSFNLLFLLLQRLY
jgi:hypothetical protein